MKYDEGAISGPEIDLSKANLTQRTASIITPAEFGGSHTSSFASGLMERYRM
jgi:hypothetical protein